VSLRATRYVGFHAGVKLIYADVELSGETVDDLVFYGPNFGLEFLY